MIGDKLEPLKRPTPDAPGQTWWERLLLGVILIELPLQLDVNLNYSYELASRGALGGFNVSLTTICLLLLYAWWVPTSAVRRRADRRHGLRTNVALLAYLAIAVCSLLVARSPAFALYELNQLGQAFLLFHYVANRIRSRSDVRFVCTLLLIGLVVQGAIMVSLPVIGHSVKIGMIHARLDEGARVGGTVGGPNGAGSYLTLLLPLALSYTLTNVSHRMKTLAGAGFVLGAASLVLTRSRGSWIGCAVAIAVLLLVAWRRRRLPVMMPALLGATAILLAVALGPMIIDRVTASDAGAAYSRIPLMEMAFAAIVDHPVLGVGANNFALVLGDYASQTRFRGLGFVYVVHNQYLVAWAETGILGLLAFVGFLVSTIALGWHVSKRNDPLIAPLAMGLIAGISGEMVHMLAELYRQRSLVQLLFLLAGLVTALYYMHRHEKRRLPVTS